MNIIIIISLAVCVLLIAVQAWLLNQLAKAIEELTEHVLVLYKSKKKLLEIIDMHEKRIGWTEESIRSAAKCPSLEM